MNRTLLALLLAGAATLTVHGAIDFTPIPSQRVLEGVTFPQLTFHENGRPVTYEQPRGWSYTGGGGRIRFTPPQLVQASAEIDQVSVAKPQEFSGEMLKLLQHQALAAVPPESQNVTLVSEAVDPFRINRQHTYEAVVSYQHFGQQFSMGVIYVNREATHLRCRSVARQEDFAKVHGAFRASLFSLAWH